MPTFGFLDLSLFRFLGLIFWIASLAVSLWLVVLFVGIARDVRAIRKHLESRETRAHSTE